MPNKGSKNRVYSLFYQRTSNKWPRSLLATPEETNRITMKQCHLPGTILSTIHDTWYTEPKLFNWTSQWAQAILFQWIVAMCHHIPIIKIYGCQIEDWMVRNIEDWNLFDIPCTCCTYTCTCRAKVQSSLYWHFHQISDIYILFRFSLSTKASHLDK